ncbi:MAG: ribose 5-phosphate isomerase B [Bryobacterales bacterium]|nr:ribose 5-phosphate isomerase B [Bryobacterales bacterium]
MKIALGADHAGFELKQALAAALRQNGHEVNDLGAHQFDPGDDYVDSAAAVARAVSGGQAARGIVVCGSGVGATVAANKLAGIRACLCHDIYSAHQGVEHDDMNVLVLGGRIIGPALAQELVEAFLRARFTAEPRHVRRLDKIRKLEEDS